MVNLLKFECRKLIKQKSLYICFGIAFVLMFFEIISIYTYSSKEMNPNAAVLMKSVLVFVPYLTLTSIFTSLYACDDYSNKTFKNIYSKGYTRIQVYLSKYIVLFIVILLMTVVSIFIGFILGKAFESETSVIDFNTIKIVLTQILLIEAFNTVYFAISMFIGKAGSSIAINLLGLGMIFMFLDLILAALEIENFYFSDYWLDSPYNKIFYGVAEKKDIVRAVIMSIIYMAGFTGLGLFLNTKKEF